MNIYYLICGCQLTVSYRFWVRTEKMEAKFYIALLIVGLISTALAKGGHRRKHDHDDHDHHGKRRGDHDGDRDKCPAPTTSPELPFKCTVTGKCDTFTCSGEVHGKAVTFRLKIDRSQDPLSAEMSVNVKEPKFDWSHTFKSGDKVQMERFPESTVFLTLTMVKSGKGIVFKLDLSLESPIVEDMDVPLLQGKLPLKEEGHDDDGDHEHHRKGRCSRAYAWFKRQPAAVKAAVVISAILGIALLITGLVYCCKKRRATPVGAVKVQPPTYDEATTVVKTKVPMEPLVNEE